MIKLFYGYDYSLILKLKFTREKSNHLHFHICLRKEHERRVLLTNLVPCCIRLVPTCCTQVVDRRWCPRSVKPRDFWVIIPRCRKRLLVYVRNSFERTISGSSWQVTRTQHYQVRVQVERLQTSLLHIQITLNKFNYIIGTSREI